MGLSIKLYYASSFQINPLDGLVKPLRETFSKKSLTVEDYLAFLDKSKEIDSKDIKVIAEDLLPNNFNKRRFTKIAIGAIPTLYKLIRGKRVEIDVTAPSPPFDYINDYINLDPEELKLIRHPINGELTSDIINAIFEDLMEFQNLKY